MRRLMTMVLTFAMIATACGGVAEEAAERIAENAIENETGGEVDIELDQDGDEVSVNVSGEEGDSNFTIGGGEIPEGFPIPVVEGGEVASVLSQTEGDITSYSVILTYDSGRYDELVSFYDDYTSSFNDRQRNETAANGRSVIWASTESQMFITVAEAEDDVSLVLNASS